MCPFTRTVFGHVAFIVVLLAGVPGCASSPDGAHSEANPGEKSIAPRPATAAPSTDVEYLNSGKVLPTNLPFSEAVRVGDVLYLSGQIGVLPGTLELAPGGTREEARQAMENIRTTLAAHGRSMRDVIKCTVVMADISEWSAFNEVYATFFAPPYPARSALGANGLALGARVEVECIAAVPH